MTSPIAIIGAGPSGLLFARFLQLADIDYIIFERDQSQTWAAGRSGSGTLDLRADSGQLALDKAGLLDAFKAKARYDVPTKFVTGRGTILVTLSDDGDTEQPEIDRKDLRNLLLAAIPSEKIRWDRKVEEIERAEDGSMSIRFVDSTVEGGFGLVVGADGAWSKVRSLVTTALPEYSGFTFLTTSISPEDPAYTTAKSLNHKGNYLVFGDEMMSTLMELADGSYHVGTGLRLPDDWRSTHAALVSNPAALGAWLVDNHLQNWSESHKEVFGQGRRPWYLWIAYGMPTESLSWNNTPGVALIGDAAHLTPPFSGGGVNSALFDSYQLATSILKHGLGSIDQAVLEYEQEMLPRGIKLTKKTEAMGELLFAPDAPRSFLQSFGLHI